MRKVPHHLMIGSTPYCDWLGMQAGRDLAERSGVAYCDRRSHADALRAVERLRPHFKAETNIRAVRGPCPNCQ